MIRPHSISTLFPYTTLFRSIPAAIAGTLVFALNPNIVYLQATPMSEPLLLALAVIGVGLVLAWAKRDNDADAANVGVRDRKSTRLNSSHQIISYAVFCLKKK